MLDGVAVETSSGSPLKVIIVGAGLIGLASAYYLRREGVEVQVIERQTDALLETSYANGAYMQRGAPDPWNAPGVFGLLVQSLFANFTGDAESAPMLMRPRALPRLTRFGLRFLANCRASKFREGLIANRRLAAYSKVLMDGLAREEGLEFSSDLKGCLVVQRSERHFESFLRIAEVAAADGGEYQVLDRDGLLENEPTLIPIGEKLVGAVRFDADESADAFAYGQKLVRRCLDMGVQFNFGTLVTHLDIGSDGARAAALGEVFHADKLVIAGGSYSGRLARGLGIYLPIAPAKGYSISPSKLAWDDPPRHAIVDLHLHALVNPLERVVRVAGTGEFAGFDLSIAKGRIDNLLSLLHSVYPDYAATLKRDELNAWTGLRPLSADGRPMIGATRRANLYVNTGHGAFGWTHAVASGRLLADAMLGQKSEIDARPYELQRFALMGR